jgi:hypothetical protein
MASVTPLRMSAPRALRLIRAAAEDTDRVAFHPHAKLRMRERRVSASQVYACLRKGVIVEGPALDAKGCWRCTMTRLAAGERVKVVVAIIPVDLLLVVTVI